MCLILYNKFEIHAGVGLLFFFFWYRCLNSGPHPYKADVLLLEPLHQSLFVLAIFKIKCLELFAQAGYKW
jgi:hypothetical protein